MMMRLHCKAIVRPTAPRLLMYVVVRITIRSDYYTHWLKGIRRISSSSSCNPPYRAISGDDHTNKLVGGAIGPRNVSVRIVVAFKFKPNEKNTILHLAKHTKKMKRKKEKNEL